jgi:hypothetical protein
MSFDEAVVDFLARRCRARGVHAAGVRRPTRHDVAVGDAGMGAPVVRIDLDRLRK